MDWKKVKLMLIVLFLFINVFLLYMLYNRNIKSYVETVSAIETVFSAQNVALKVNIRDIQKNNRMSKLFITNSEKLNDNLLISLEEAETYEHIGRKKSIVDITVLLANFIRDVAPIDITIKNILLGYYFNKNQVAEDVMSGEAEPCWIIETDTNTYVYNAYNGKLIK